MKQVTFWIIAVVGLVLAIVLLGMSWGLGFIVGAVFAKLIYPELAKGVRMLRGARGISGFWAVALVLTLLVYFFLGGAWATGLIVGLIFGEIWG